MKSLCICFYEVEKRQDFFIELFYLCVFTDKKNNETLKQ